VTREALAARGESVTRYGLYSGGKPVIPSSAKFIPVENPHTGKVWAEVVDATPADVEATVADSKRAFEDSSWRQMKTSARGKLMWKFGELLEKHADELARLETMCNGKVIRETRSQMRSFSKWLYYVGGLADKIHGEVVPVEMDGMFN
jgi:acyl-CoA reductase-like NAD-dependent aldehyde dehydrogenase